MRQTGFRGDRGGAAPEYALIIALVAAVVIIAVATLGGTGASLYDEPCNELNSVGVSC
jgi:Flp pilus assembly pilin Flp